jgi:hypothetical protein
MNLLRAYVIITCSIFWQTPEEHVNEQPTPQPETVCHCCLPAQEPDWECADWQAKNGKVPEWIKGEWH